MSMSRKDFQIIAEELKHKAPYSDDHLEAHAQRSRDLEGICRALRQINPNFNEDKFREACAINGDIK